jgi:putative transposase
MNAGLKRSICLEILGLTRHQLYYKPNGRRVGVANSVTTKKLIDNKGNIEWVHEDTIVKEIITIKENPDLGNWYRLICAQLNFLGYYINHKKVYRIMFDYSLLEPKVKRGERNYVKYRRVCPNKPLQILEIDIKYVWINGTKKYAFVMTIIDTFTRVVLHWRAGYQMTQHQVKDSWEYVIVKYLQPEKTKLIDIEIEIRNDNGKQFDAKLVRDFLSENGLNQVFTHPYTPEENGHIESFHSTLGKCLDKEYFKDLVDLEQRLKTFYNTYNTQRAHGSIMDFAPTMFWALFIENKVEIQIISKSELKFATNETKQEIRFNKKVKEISTWVMGV